MYLVLKYIHIFAAIVMIGISLANGLGKLFADRTGNVHRMASVTALTVHFNKWLVLPSLIALAASGIGLAHTLRLPLLDGWVAQSIILLLLLFALFFIGNRYEHRLSRIAGESEASGLQTIAGQYWRVSRMYFLFGSPVIAVILLILYLMVFQRGLF